MPITLNEISSLSQALLDAESAVTAAEQELKRAQERARQLREETLPAAMQELGLDELRLETGERIRVQQDIYASIPVSHRDAAFGWLEQHGHDGIIKTDVSVRFGRGELSAAAALAERLEQQDGLPAVLTRSVHPQTLKAFLREQVAAGVDVPLDVFGARPVWTAKITK